MKPTHRYDTKAYHDYYIHQAGKRYPVFAGRRYQRGHGLGSIFGGHRDVAACLIFIPCTTSPAIFNPVFKASRSKVVVPFFNKGMAVLKSPGAGDDYIDLANTYPFVEAQIMDDDNTALDGGANVGSVNLWMHSLFSDVSISHK
jgi:hypothetical protein